MFTVVQFVETLNRLEIMHRRTAYHHRDGNSYLESFHLSLKEGEVWATEYRSVPEARESIARWSSSTITTVRVAASEIELRVKRP